MPDTAAGRFAMSNAAHIASSDAQAISCQRELMGSRSTLFPCERFPATSYAN